MGSYSLYGFRFESESLLLVSDQEDLSNTEAEYEQWQHLLELDAQVGPCIIASIEVIHGFNVLTVVHLSAVSK